ncbi:MAG: RluA family pseudouridine synthase [Candidatus Delongbacteria bacterium]|nr:RluA family pseudouridine synthase [Candidatus Delongbacteria bacterium]
MPPISFTVEAACQGQRLDHFLHQWDSEITRSRIQQAIRSGSIRVNGRPVKTGYALSIGDRIEGELEAPQPESVPQPEAIPLSIIYQDEYLVVINKPPGMVVHPAAGHSRSTLVNALLHHIQGLSAGSHPIRPGIVHRLDKDTSGLLIIARTDAVHARLAQALKERRIRKYYLALVWNTPDPDRGRIELPLGRHPRDRKRIVPDGLRARDARSDYRVLASREIVSLVGIRLITGRTHQIRVHLQAIRHPVVGDPVYGQDPVYCKSMPPLLRREMLAPLSTVSRQMLHAWSLGFIHPVTGMPVCFFAPLPDDFSHLLAQIRITPPSPEDFGWDDDTNETEVIAP